MAGNHVLLETISLTQSAASVTFDNIPQTGYTDLKVVVSARTTGSAGSPWSPIRALFNGVYSNWKFTSLYGIGSSASSGGSASENEVAFATSSTNTASTFGNSEFLISNYTSSNYKSISSDSTTENNATSTLLGLTANLWSNTAAITSITLPCLGSDGSFATGSTFSLYGVAELNITPTVAPKATGGNIVANDGTYWYHAFLTSGLFTPQTSLTCHYLVVAGGGGGGGNNGAGGGAGGLRSTVTATGGGGSLESPLSLSASTNYPVFIGSGGAGSSGNIATSGTNSSFSTITSIAGGAGGGLTFAGVSGGSGGGGAGVGNAAGAAGTTNQGYAGGAGTTNQNAGGGGGAGQIGETAIGGSANQGGKGGDGVQITSFANATNTGANSGYYAGGGGGGGGGGNPALRGTGGLGGGGQGGYTTGITAGTASTGGGGGGGAGSGAAGGSGIVIIRYAMV